MQSLDDMLAPPAPEAPLASDEAPAPAPALFTAAAPDADTPGTDTPTDTPTATSEATPATGPSPAVRNDIQTDIQPPVAPALAEAPDLTRRLLDARLDQAEAVARARYPDFDTKVQVFARLAAVDPALLARLHTHADPAEYAYRLGSTALEAGRQAHPTPPLPESLSGSLSAGHADTAPWRPKTLSEILGGNRSHG